jgi:DNA-binding response OmpR family regulator
MILLKEQIQDFRAMTMILVVEDESKIARVLKLELEHEGYEVQIETDGKAGFERALNNDWDLMILDIMLPKMSGIEVLRKLRSSGTMLPIILLTARDSLTDKVSGLDYGANDYITKPFAIEELLARIRSLLKYSFLGEAQEKEELIFKDIHVELKSRTLTRDEQVIELTPREYDLIVYLLKNKNQALTREQILNEVWGYEFMGDTNVVDVYIRYLRQKIDKGYTKKWIKTVRGVGYMIKE